MVAGRLARRIGTVGEVRVGLTERRVGGAERPEDLVGRHVEEPERVALGGSQAAPVGAGRLQETEGADDVRGDELPRTVNRAVDVALRREMDDRPHAVFGEESLHERLIADVATDERVPGVAVEGGEIAHVPGVGELVEVDDRLVVGREPVEDEVAADESGAAGDENHVGPVPEPERHGCEAGRGPAS